MGNFSGPQMMGGFSNPQMQFGAKRRYSPEQLSDSPRPYANNPLPYSDAPIDINRPTPTGSGRLSSPAPIGNYTPAGAGGDSMGRGTSNNPLGNQIGTSAAANIGTSGLLSLVSSLPAAAAASGQGVPFSSISPYVFGSTMSSMLGPAGIANSLLGAAYAAYQGKKAATSQGLTSTGTASAEAMKSINSPLGIAGQLFKGISNLFNPYSTSAMTTAREAAINSAEAKKVGFQARLGQGLTGLGTPQSRGGFTPDPQAMASLLADLGANAPMSPEDAIMGMPAYGQPGGISGRHGGVGDMTAIGGRWGGIVDHQGDPVGGNQSGDPGVGGDMGSASGEGGIGYGGEGQY
jgi:hypothetical protein